MEQCWAISVDLRVGRRERGAKEGQKEGRCRTLGV